MKKALAFCLLMFSTLMNANEIEVVPVEIPPKLVHRLFWLIRENKDEEAVFSISARVSDIESWKKLLVVSFGYAFKDDISWIVFACVTEKQLNNILDQSFVISVESTSPVYPVSTTVI